MGGLLSSLGDLLLKPLLPKGDWGERIVARRLRDGLPGEYLVRSNIYLPLPDGTTTQIDHIVISQFGIFVVETKTYSGWIFGDEKSPQWTQSLPGKKSKFQNPLRQNYRHICALADNLGIDKSYFHSVIAFTGDCEFKTKMPPNVVYSRSASAYIRSVTTPLIKPGQIGEIDLAVEEWQAAVSRERRLSHVENLQRRHEDVGAGDQPLCSFCGGEMVLRKRKSDGKAFYGCKRYPNCRGIRNVAEP